MSSGTRRRVEGDVELLARATAPLGADGGLPRTVLVFAHPDDESIGMGARLARLASSRCIHVTDGSPRDGRDSRAHGFTNVDDYRRARAAELDRALSVAGAGRLRRECLGVPDQEAAFELAPLALRLAAIFEQERCEIVFTHPYEGGHPDHDACAFAVDRAVALLRARQRAAPLVAECAFYHRGPAGLQTGVFLDRHPPSARATEVVRSLSLADRERKSAILSCFVTQREVLRPFSRERESFRLAPEYDFHRPPHAGFAHYDAFGWKVTSDRFCALAREADATLRKRDAAC